MSFIVQIFPENTQIQMLPHPHGLPKHKNSATDYNQWNHIGNTNRFQPMIERDFQPMLQH